MVFQRISGAYIRNRHTGDRFVRHYKIHPCLPGKLGVAGSASRPVIDFSVQRHGFIRKVHLTYALNKGNKQIFPIQRDRLIAASVKQRIELAQRHIFVRPAHFIIPHNAAAQGRFSRGIELIIHTGYDGTVFFDYLLALLHRYARLIRAVKHGHHIVGAILRDRAVGENLLPERHIGHGNGKDQNRGQSADEQRIHSHFSGESPQDHRVGSPVFQLFVSQQHPGDGSGQCEMSQKYHHQIQHQPKQQNHAVLITEGRHQVPVGNNQTADESGQCHRRKYAPKGRMLLAFLRRFRPQQLRHRDLFEIPQGNQRGQKKHTNADGQSQQNSLRGISGDGKGQLHDGSKQRHNELKDHKPRAHAHKQGK